MKRLLMLALLAGCMAEPEVIAVAPVEPAPVAEPRRQFSDDNIPFDLTAGADITVIPDYWVEIFCTLTWESRAEPFTGIEQWNPCLRPDMFTDGPRVAQVPEPTPEPIVEPEVLEQANPVAAIRAEPVQQQTYVIPSPIASPVVTARSVEFDIAPDPTLFLNPDGSFSRRRQ